MVLCRCHFLNVHDHIEAHEEIDAGSFIDAIDRANGCSTTDRTMTRSRFGPAIGGFTARGVIAKVLSRHAHPDAIEASVR
jgi:hypothetical protein